MKRKLREELNGLKQKKQEHTLLFCVVHQRADVELLVVQRDRDSVVSERPGPKDQLLRRVRDVVDRIIGRVRVQLDFEHGRGVQPSVSVTYTYGFASWL